MTLLEWQAEMKEALALRERDPTAAARQLGRLASKARRTAANGLGDWEFEQSLGLAAMTLAESGDVEGAARLWTFLNERARKRSL